MSFYRTVIAAAAICFGPVATAHAQAVQGGPSTATPTALVAIPEEVARQQLLDELGRLFLGEDFAALERAYNEAIRTDARFPSGVHRAGWYVRGIPRALGPPPAAQGPHPLARSAREAHWTEMERKARKWAEAFPASSGAAVFQSVLLVRHGFSHRGGGFSASVAAEDMELFKAYVERAYAALIAREQSGRKDPNWHVHLLELGRLQSWSPKQRYATAIQDALQAFPYFYELHFEIAHGLSPIWGGSIEALERYAREAVELTKTREGQSMYARIYWSAASSLGGDPVEDGKAEWPRFRAGFEDIVARYPDLRNWNAMAWYACMAKDAATIRRAFEQIGDRFDRTIWGSPKQVDYCRRLGSDADAGATRR
jgi:hypothetical protein